MNTSSDIATQREGLPASYQMRADAHYVDLLDHVESGPTLRILPVARFSTEPRADVAPAFVESVRLHGVLQPLIVRRDGGDYRLIDGGKRLAAAVAAGVSTVPCLVHQIDAQAAAALQDALRITPAVPDAADHSLNGAAESTRAAVGRASRALVRSVGQLRSCSLLLENDDVAQRTLADVVRVEAARSWCLATLLPVIGDAASSDHAMAPYPARRLVERVTALCDAERRLAAGVLDTKLALRDATQLLVNADLVLAACGGLVLAAFDACSDRRSPRVELVLESRGADGCVVSIAAPRPDGSRGPSPFASTIVAGAEVVAGMHGGRLTTSPRDGVALYSMHLTIST